MATSILALKDVLVSSTKNQRTPTAYTDDEYIEFSRLGCKRFYIDTGIESLWEIEYSDGATPLLTRNLNVLEKEYCLLCAEIYFFENVRNYWNTLVSYTTNALKIANANKPFEFINETINQKERKLIDLFHKMEDISYMSTISEINAMRLEVRYRW